MEYHPEEFVSSKITIIKSKNKSLEKIEGIIINETKKTFKIKTINGDKTVMKMGSDFLIAKKLIKGDNLLQKPEDRIKFRR